MKTTKRKKLTYGQALDIQRDDIRRWETVLNATTLEALHAECRVQNNLFHDSPYDVFRGNDITTWIQNYSITLTHV